MNNFFLYRYKDLLLDAYKRYNTPLYVYFLDIIKERVSNLDNILRSYLENYLVAYACKACSLLYICKYLNELGLGAEVVSDGELYIALKSGFRKGKIIFDGVSKSDSEIEYALMQEIYSINCESLDEIKVISAIARKRNITVDVGLRVNPKINVHTHEYLRTGSRYNKFGIDYEEIIRNIDMVKKFDNVNVKGFHFHLGSNISSSKPFIDAIDKVSKLIAFAIDRGYDIEYLDIGGGIPVIKDKKLLHRYLSPILESIKEKILDIGDIKIILEPGRYIVADSAVLLTKVNYVKKVDEREWILIDAGMNDFIRPALYDVYHPIICLTCSSNEKRIYSVGGPVCESADVFAKDIELQAVKRGDILMFLDVGAYGVSMSSNYNSRRRSAVIAVEKGETKLIRMREEFKDLIDKEIT